MSANVAYFFLFFIFQLDLMTKIESHHQVMLHLKDLYSKTVDADQKCKGRNLPKDLPILMKFKEACRKDMAVC